MTNQPNEALAVPHDGRKPDWLDDLDRVFKDAEGMTFVFARSSIWKGDCFLPADHWASPVLRLRASTGENWVPWNAKLQGDGPPADWDGSTVILRSEPCARIHANWPDVTRAVIGYIAIQPREESEPSGGELKACPNETCRSANVSFITTIWGNSYLCECLDCCARGPVRSTKDDAIAAWNARTPSPTDALLEKAEPARRFKLGDWVSKRSGSSWRGYVVGFYSTKLTPIGYCIESDSERGSVQIYPEAALNFANPLATLAEIERERGK
jgi:hypothetical protein